MIERLSETKGQSQGDFDFRADLVSAERRRRRQSDVDLEALRKFSKELSFLHFPRMPRKAGLTGSQSPQVTSGETCSPTKIDAGTFSGKSLTMFCRVQSNERSGRSSNHDNACRFHRHVKASSSPGPFICACLMTIFGRIPGHSSQLRPHGEHIYHRCVTLLYSGFGLSSCFFSSGFCGLGCGLVCAGGRACWRSLGGGFGSRDSGRFRCGSTGRFDSGRLASGRFGSGRSFGRELVSGRRVGSG